MPNLSAWMSICNRLITCICLNSSCFSGELSHSCSCLPALHETQKAGHLYPSYTGVWKQVRAGFLRKSCLASQLFSLLFPFLFARLLLAKCCFFYCTNKCTHTFFVFLHVKKQASHIAAKRHLKVMVWVSVFPSHHAWNSPLTQELLVRLWHKRRMDLLPFHL